MASGSASAALLRRLLTGSLLVAAGMVACPGVAAADWLGPERRIVASEVFELWPQLSGSRVVYTTNASTGDGVDIRVRDLTKRTDRVLTPDHRATGAASISGDQVVWTEGSGAAAQVHHFDLSTGAHGTIGPKGGSSPAVSKSLVCYTAGDRVRVHNLETGSDLALSPAGAVAGECDISGETVVWVDDRTDSAQVYLHDLDTDVEEQVSEPVAQPSAPRVDQDLLAWRDDRTDAPGIYAFDRATEQLTPVATSVGRTSAPEISEGRVVWADDRAGHGNTEVYLADLASGVETRVTRDDAWSGTPTIDGARVIYSDARSGAPHLYQRLVTPPKISAELGVSEEDGTPQFAGKVTGEGGVRVVGAPVVLQTSTDRRTWADVDSATTAGDGSYSFAVPEVADPTWLRVSFPGTHDFAPTYSREHLVEPG